jgi:hypothetical protein
MSVLLEWNRLGLVADVDLEATRTCGDRQPLIAELSDDVKRFTWWLFESEPELVGGDRALDLSAHVRRRLEKAIGRYESVERLVRPLEVVMTDEVIQTPLRIDDVREHGAAEKLVPERLPEALDLAERLRMLWPTADVLHAQTREQLFELRLAAPDRVLTTVVGQHLRRRSVRGDAALECLHHQRRLLVMRERVTYDEATVVVHEHAHVQPLRAPQPKREDVRLPELIRRCSFEATGCVLALRHRRRRLDQSFRVEDLSDLVFAHAQRFETRQHVSDTPRAPRLVFTLERDDLFLFHDVRCLRPTTVTSAT